VDARVELPLALVLLEVGPVDADNVTNLADKRAVLESSGIDDHGGNFEVLVTLVAKSVVGAVNHLESADPLVLDVARVLSVNDHSVNVNLVFFGAIEVELVVSSLFAIMADRGAGGGTWHFADVCG